MTEAFPNTVPIELLLIDDDDRDIFLTKRAFKKNDIASQIHVAKNGEEGLASLRQEKPFEIVPRPDLILLDLNMPRMTGFEFLEVVKSDKELSLIPVIVMTNSQSDVDMRKSYRHRANAFISKPIELSDFMDVMKTIERFWFSAVRLPQQRGT